MSLNEFHLLFVGDIASGKTTIINAILKEYFRDVSSISKINENILYINNLREQGIYYYRNDVKIFCQTFSSIKGKKKWVVLDDIDIINEQCQQIFRSYIDKYGKNVHFLCSCTNVQKVISNLQSRLFVLNIHRLSREHLQHMLNYIKEKEQIDIDNDAEEFILTISNHNPKIMIHFMEKFQLLQEPIHLSTAMHLCSNIHFIAFNEYTQFLLNKQLSAAIQKMMELVDYGYSVIDILDNYFLFVKMTDLFTENQKFDLLHHLCNTITIFHTIHEDDIELVFFTNHLYKCLFS